MQTAPNSTQRDYVRHRPESSLLYRVVQENFETLTANAKSRSGGQSFPVHVYREVEEYLTCGILANGFVRVSCGDCKNEKLVAFSCKRRGFCPSCGGRRMNEVALHLVDKILPKVPVRQWVLSFPFSVRYALAYNPSLVTQVLSVYIRIISNWYFKAARKNGIRGKTAAITFVQRFGGAINLNVHFHSLFLDGVFTFDQDKPKFTPVFPPSDEQIVTLVSRINARVSSLLEKRGYELNDFSEDPFAHEQPVLAGILSSSVQNRIALGEREGLRVRKIGGEYSIGNAYRVSPRCALSDGFSLHADVQIKRKDRQKLERLCRYAARPPIALERMSQREDGKILYRLKTRYSDGTTHVLFDPLELVEKAVALIPPPRANLLRYHGLLAPNSKRRSQIVPSNSEKKKAKSPYPEQTKWAELLKKSFSIDVLKCSKCGGKMRVLSVIKDSAIARRILEAKGMWAEPPKKSPPRAPPELELGDHLPSDDFSQILAPDQFG